jgi:hypothetical protein
MPGLNTRPINPKRERGSDGILLAHASGCYGGRRRREVLNSIVMRSDRSRNKIGDVG